MMKKLVSGVLIGLMLAGSGFVGNPAQAAGVENESSVQAEQSIEAIKPQASYTVTTNSTAVVSGKGDPGTPVLLEVYAQANNISMQRDADTKTVKFTKLTTKEYFKVGSMGIFVKEIKLSLGENKVIIRSLSDGAKIEKIVNFKQLRESSVKKSMEQLKESSVTQLVNSMISQ